MEDGERLHGRAVLQLDHRGRSRGRLLTLEGYAYAPYFDKRPYIREVEGLIRTSVPCGRNSADNPLRQLA